MGMRVSQAVSKAKNLTVQFEDAELQVTYRPLSYTIREMDEMQAEQAAAGPQATRRIMETIQKLVVSWDLEDDDGKAIPLDVDIDDPSNPLREIKSNIFTEIIQAVNEDQKPGGSKPSGA